MKSNEMNQQQVLVQQKQKYKNHPKKLKDTNHEKDQKTCERRNSKLLATETCTALKQSYCSPTERNNVSSTFSNNRHIPSHSARLFCTDNTYSDENILPSSITINLANHAERVDSDSVRNQQMSCLNCDIQDGSPKNLDDNDIENSSNYTNETESTTDEEKDCDDSFDTLNEDDGLTDLIHTFGIEFKDLYDKNNTDDESEDLNELRDFFLYQSETTDESDESDDNFFYSTENYSCNGFDEDEDDNQLVDSYNCTLSNETHTNDQTISNNKLRDNSNTQSSDNSDDDSGDNPDDDWLTTEAAMSVVVDSSLLSDVENKQREYMDKEHTVQDDMYTEFIEDDEDVEDNYSVEGCMSCLEYDDNNNNNNNNNNIYRDYDYDCDFVSSSSSIVTPKSPLQTTLCDSNTRKVTFGLVHIREHSVTVACLCYGSDDNDGLVGSSSSCRIQLDWPYYDRMLPMTVYEHERVRHRKQHQRRMQHEHDQNWNSYWSFPNNSSFTNPRKSQRQPCPRLSSPTDRRMRIATVQGISFDDVFLIELSTMSSLSSIKCLQSAPENYQHNYNSNYQNDSNINLKSDQEHKKLQSENDHGDIITLNKIENGTESDEYYYCCDLDHGFQ